MTFAHFLRQSNRGRPVCRALAACLLSLPLMLASVPLGAASPEGSLDLAHQSDLLSRALPLWSGLPFAGILLSIAVFPLLAPHFWHRHFKKLAVAWAMIFAAPFLVQYGRLAGFKLLEVLLVDYVPFLILLWGLYTVSGGILLRATLVATPAMNVAFLAVGTMLASLMGTTGASMLLVRPVLRANSWRHHKTHVFVFLIFLVSNIGGLLTPLGDPPLFLGFIHGVPFFWTMRLLPHFLVVSGLVLAVFFLVDSWYFRREVEARPTHDLPHKRRAFHVEGAHNFLLLLGILGAVLLSGVWQTGGTLLLGIHFEHRNVVRDLLIVVVGLLSIVTTNRQVREDNGFTWDAIREVGYLFFGIFVTIIPVLMILRAGPDGAMGFLVSRVREPWHYLWMSGALSSFLDNAPTYLTFFNMALGQQGIHPTDVHAVLSGAVVTPHGARFALNLAGVSAGAVLFGANTYIGNAPNFMVLSIAKEHGVRMPSFFHYMAWSAAVLLPIFFLLSLIFF